MQQLSVRLPEVPLTVTPEQFAAIAAENPDLRLERDASGELIVNPPTGWESSARNSQLARHLANWADGYGGVVLESSGGCQLPSGAVKSRVCQDFCVSPTAAYGFESAQTQNF